MKVAHVQSVAIPADVLDRLSSQVTAIFATIDALRSASTVTVESKYIDQQTSPLSKRVFLDHARKGSFPTKRVGKRVLVERDVFERWLEQQTARSRRSAAPPPASGPRSIDEVVLAELGARKAVAR